MAKKYLVGTKAAFEACKQGTAIAPCNITDSSYIPIVLDELVTAAKERLVVNTSVHGSANVIREPILPYENDVQMFRYVGSIQQIKNFVTGAIVPPAQYSVVDGKVHFGAGFTMLASDWPSAPSGDSGTDAASYRKDGSRIRVTNTYASSYLSQQVLVDYTPSSVLAFVDVPSFLPRFTRLMNQQSSIGITFNGDSITAGADSSFNFSLQPVQRYWAKLLTGFFNDLNPNVRYRNVAVAGQTSAYGAGHAAADLAPKTDLLVIAYGMNDQAAELSKVDFKANLKTMMDVAIAANPNVEFVLISGMRPEVTWIYARDWYLNAYREAMHELATFYGAANKVVVVDVTSEYDRYVQRKGFAHTTGSGVNHPCDFGHVLYTQTILHRLGYL